MNLSLGFLTGKHLRVKKDLSNKPEKNKFGGYQCHGQSKAFSEMGLMLSQRFSSSFQIVASWKTSNRGFRGHELTHRHQPSRSRDYQDSPRVNIHQSPSSVFSNGGLSKPQHCCLALETPCTLKVWLLFDDLEVLNPRRNFCSPKEQLMIRRWMWWGRQHHHQHSNGKQQSKWLIGQVDGASYFAT